MSGGRELEPGQVQAAWTEWETARLACTNGFCADPSKPTAAELGNERVGHERVLDAGEELERLSYVVIPAYLELCARAEAEAQRVAEIKGRLEALLSGWSDHRTEIVQVAGMGRDFDRGNAKGKATAYQWAIDDLRAALAQAPAPATEQPGGEEGRMTVLSRNAWPASGVARKEGFHGSGYRVKKVRHAGQWIDVPWKLLDSWDAPKPLIQKDGRPRKRVGGYSNHPEKVQLMKMVCPHCTAILMTDVDGSALPGTDAYTSLLWLSWDTWKDHLVCSPDCLVKAVSPMTAPDARPALADAEARDVLLLLAEWLDSEQIMGGPGHPSNAQKVMTFMALRKLNPSRLRLLAQQQPAAPAEALAGENRRLREALIGLMYFVDRGVYRFNGDLSRHEQWEKAAEAARAALATAEAGA